MVNHAVLLTIDALVPAAGNIEGCWPTGDCGGRGFRRHKVSLNRTLLTNKVCVNLNLTVAGTYASTFISTAWSTTPCRVLTVWVHLRPEGSHVAKPLAEVTHQ